MKKSFTKPLNSLTILILIISFFVLNFTAIAISQVKDFPNKPITLVVPKSAGGSHDMIARAISSVAHNYLKGNPVIVELRPGAGGAIAANYVVNQAKSDGYTLFFGGNAENTYLPIVQKDQITYSKDDFIPIALIMGTSTQGIMVPVDSPFNSLEELIQYAKEHPGELTYGSAGTWGVNHIPMMQFFYKAGIDVIHVPYDGGGPARLALISGEVDMANLSDFNWLPELKNGTVKVFAVLSEERLEYAPDIPTAKELGYDVVEYSYRTIFTPKGTPKEHIEILRRAFREICEDESFVAMLDKLETPVTYMNGPDFQKVMNEMFENVSEAITPLLKK